MRLELTICPLHRIAFPALWRNQTFPKSKHQTCFSIKRPITKHFSINRAKTGVCMVLVSFQKLSMGGFLAEIFVSFPRCLNPHPLWSLRCRWDPATSRQETDRDLLEMVRESAIQLDFGAKNTHVERQFDGWFYWFAKFLWRPPTNKFAGLTTIDRRKWARNIKKLCHLRKVAVIYVQDAHPP